MNKYGESHKTYSDPQKIHKHQYDHKTLLKLYQTCESMSCIIEPTKELGAIYIGNIDAASDYSLLRRHQIKCVLTVAARTGLKYNENIVPYHEIIVCDDHPSQDLTKFFDQIYKFIEKYRKETNILVHCFAGISRSCSSVIMYLMKKQQWTYEKAFYHCRQKRKVCNPNPGFIKQLLQYERKLIEERINQENAQKGPSSFLNFNDQKKELQKQIQKQENNDYFQNRLALFREQEQQRQNHLIQQQNMEKLQNYQNNSDMKFARSSSSHNYANNQQQLHKSQTNIPFSQFRQQIEHHPQNELRVVSPLQQKSILNPHFSNTVSGGFMREKNQLYNSQMFPSSSRENKIDPNKYIGGYVPSMGQNIQGNGLYQQQQLDFSKQNDNNHHHHQGYSNGIASSTALRDNQVRQSLEKQPGQYSQPSSSHYLGSGPNLTAKKNIYSPDYFTKTVQNPSTNFYSKLPSSQQSTINQYTNQQQNSIINRERKDNLQMGKQNFDSSSLLYSKYQALENQTGKGNLDLARNNIYSTNSSSAFGRYHNSNYLQSHLQHNQSLKYPQSSYGIRSSGYTDNRNTDMMRSQTPSYLPNNNTTIGSRIKFQNRF